MIKKIYMIFVAIILVIVLIVGCTNQDNEDGIDDTQIGDITITSTAFEDGGTIPLKYSCDSDDISPPLSFGNIPDGTVSLALIMDDPDAPSGTWVHWIVFNIPPETTGIEENEIISYNVGKNSWDEIGYGGPCPPSGQEHRYYFRLYALDTNISLPDGATRQEVDNAMSGHILGQTHLMGKYSS